MLIISNLAVADTRGLLTIVDMVVLRHIAQMLRLQSMLPTHVPSFLGTSTSI